jgi:hypothetical protein
MEHSDPVDARKSMLLDHLPNYPALWDLHHKDYRNKHLKETITATLDRELSFEGNLFSA